MHFMRKILRYNDLVERGICGSRMTLHRMRKEPEFPVAVEIAGGIGFFEDEINAWLEARPRRAPKKAAESHAEAP
jgi:predicted DNA-binding transcriptional regulator AlpA